MKDTGRPLGNIFYFLSFLTGFHVFLQEIVFFSFLSILQLLFLWFSNLIYNILLWGLICYSFILLTIWTFLWFGFVSFSLFDIYKSNTYGRCRANDLCPITGRYERRCIGSIPLFASMNYCQYHHNLKCLYVKKYHFVDARDSFENIKLFKIAHVELEMRKIFIRRFCINVDKKHREWMDKLDLIVKRKKCSYNFY